MTFTPITPTPVWLRVSAGRCLSAEPVTYGGGRVPVWVAALLLLGSVAAATPAAADGRVALVIGNSAYEHTGDLFNPGNDAADMGAALARLGFAVTQVRDAGKAALDEALGEFADLSAGADVALVFYAGHGLEVNGTNYLMPVDARLPSDTRVRFEMVPLDDVLAATEGAGLRVVILDACRDNPLARRMQRSARTRSASRGAFGEVDEDLLGDEMLVAYSAAAGTVALDGEGRNSPYTEALLEYLDEPLELGTVFRRVRSRVLEATDRGQRPHEYGSLLNDHFLAGRAGGPDPAPVAAQSGPAPVIAPPSGSSLTVALIVGLVALGAAAALVRFRPRRASPVGPPGVPRDEGLRREPPRGVAAAVAAPGAPPAARRDDVALATLQPVDGSKPIPLSRALLSSREGLVIGRDAELCHVAIRSSAVSRRHVRLRASGAAILAEDLNSLRGTQTDGVELKPFEPRTIASGQRLDLGGSSYLVRRGDGSRLP